MKVGNSSYLYKKFTLINQVRGPSTRYLFILLATPHSAQRKFSIDILLYSLGIKKNAGIRFVFPFEIL